MISSIMNADCSMMSTQYNAAELATHDNAEASINLSVKLSQPLALWNEITNNYSITLHGVQGRLDAVQDLVHGNTVEIFKLFGFEHNRAVAVVASLKITNMSDLLKQNSGAEKYLRFDFCVVY